MNKEKTEKLAEISARVMKVIDYLGETPNSFATKLGYQRAQTIYDIQKMKSAPSFDFFQRFSNAGYSVSISLDWLLTGNGEMLLKQETIQSMPQQDGFIYKMYQEKEQQVQKLTEELRAMERKVGNLEAELKHAETLGYRTARNVSTKKPSLQPKADAPSASVPLNEQ